MARIDLSGFTPADRITLRKDYRQWRIVDRRMRHTLAPNQSGFTRSEAREFIAEEILEERLIRMMEASRN